MASTVDYIKLAAMAARSLPTENFAVLAPGLLDVSGVDVPQNLQYVRPAWGVFPGKEKWGYEDQVVHVTPFDRTIKTDSDMVFPKGFNPRWDTYSENLMYAEPANLAGQIVESPYRYGWRGMLHNNVHSAYFYFDKSEETYRFYKHVGQVINGVKAHSVIENLRDTDFAYCVAADSMYLEGTNVRPQGAFHHMKSGIVFNYPSPQGLESAWTQHLNFHIEKGTMIVAGHELHLPIHYYVKEPGFLRLLERFVNA